MDVQGLHEMMERCAFGLTDGGGIPWEPPQRGKAVVVLRRETERPEEVQACREVLAGIKTEDIVCIADDILMNEKVYGRMAQAQNPYGDGHASARIVSHIQEYFQENHF